MLARVKQDYASGAVIAFSGREYVRSEWREVPAGYEEQAKNHPLLEVQPSLDEIRSHGPTAPGLKEPPAVTVETPKSEPKPEEPPAVTVETPEPEPEPKPEESQAVDPEPKTPRRPRPKRAAED